MARLMLANQATAAKRRVYFDLRDATDGITAETGEAGGQPQISTNGGAWTNTGIGTLVAIGNGRYYAELTQAAVQTAGDVIETRFKSANTAESPGDSVQVVAFDPDNASNLGLSNLDAAITTRASQTSVNAIPAVAASGAADSGSTTTMVDAARTEADTDYWLGCWIRFTSGNLAGQTRLITGFNPATDTITFAPAVTQAVSTHTYEILPGGRVAGVVGDVSGSVGTVLAHAANSITAAAFAADAANEIADAVWAIAIESGISASAALTNDTGTQLTAITAKQAHSLYLSALAGVVANAGTTSPTFKPAAKPAGNTRIAPTVDADGNRSALTLKTVD